MTDSVAVGYRFSNFPTLLERLIRDFTSVRFPAITLSNKPASGEEETRKRKERKQTTLQLWGEKIERERVCVCARVHLQVTELMGITGLLDDT